MDEISLTPIPLGLALRHHGLIIGLVLDGADGWFCGYSRRGYPTNAKRTQGEVIQELIDAWVTGHPLAEIA